MRTRMRNSLSAKANEQSTKACRLGASVVALLLGPLAAGCTGGDLDDATEELGEISQAVCAANNLTTTTVTASSTRAGTTNTPSLSVDNNTGTRWESEYSDPQWIQVDLGASKFVNGVTINWEPA